MKPGISVCFVVKNGLINGYPFWESLHSCLPFADEIIISEGFSRDKTYEAILKFAELHKDKVKLFRTKWERFHTPYGEVISHVSQEAMSKCSHEWIYYLQADEIVHEGNHEFLRKVGRNEFPKFNSVSFPYKHCLGTWNPLPPDHPAYSEAIRMVKNTSAIKLLGDGWNFTGAVSPCYPAGAVPKPIFHLGWVFPKNIDQKNVEQGEIYKEMDQYQEKAEISRTRLKQGYEEKKKFSPPDNTKQFPKGLDRLFGKFEYKLPDGILP